MLPSQRYCSLESATNCQNSESLTCLECLGESNTAKMQQSRALLCCSCQLVRILHPLLKSFDDVESALRLPDQAPSCRNTDAWMKCTKVSADP